MTTDINLEEIKSPADIRTMTDAQLKQLAKELRQTLITKLSKHGGHVGPNLGMVDAIIALHYVFNTPEDKVVFDVSHQTYPHKMLTGRMDAFTQEAHYDDVTGYTNPSESPYDLFSLGHTSSAVALAAGMAKARDLKGEKHNVIAVIGDGSLSGGIAFEGLDYGATLGSNFIVIVNDNDMSIAENHGGIYADLRLLRNSKGEAEPNLFRSMGYAYRYVHNGNDIPSLIETFRSVKDINYPVVVHINTEKGMGLPVAEAHKEQFHYSGPFDPKTGEATYSSDAEDYSDIFALETLRRIEEDKRVVAITAGTPGVLGFTPEKRRQAGRQFVDVGIAEQAAVDVASGLAKGGARPVVGLASTFLQRAFDQFSQDIALNRQPATFVVFYGGLYGLTDETHLGFFDISLLANIPGLEVLVPTCKEEFVDMLRWATLHSTVPTVVRAPSGAVVSRKDVRLLSDYTAARYDIVRHGSRVALIGAGTFFPLMSEAADELAKQGVDATLINPRQLSTLDKETLDTLGDYDIVITAEDGIVEGGFGQKVASYLGQAPVKVVNLGLPKAFLNRYNPRLVAEQCNLTVPQIVALATDNLR